MRIIEYLLDNQHFLTKRTLVTCERVVVTLESLIGEDTGDIWERR